LGSFIVDIPNQFEGQMFPIHDPVLIFAIMMVIVLIAPLLAEKLKLPGMIGLLFCGILIGPHLFGVLERDKTIELLGTIGLLYIMFQAGLEINLNEVKKDRHYSLMFGFSTFLIPLILGVLGAYFFLHLSLPASVLLASMFSSHTLLTFPIVSRMGLAKRKAVTATIGGTIVTDTLAFLILAVVVGANQGELTLVFWVKMILFMLGYVLAVLFFLPKISSWFFRHFSTESGVEEYVFVIAALFTSAYLSHLAGFEPVIGAFLAGLTLNPLIPEKSILMNRIQFVGNSLFIPFFLISVGMLIDPGAFASDLQTLKISAMMIGIAIFSKWAAAGIFGKLAGFGKPERNLIFGLSVNQAAATLAAVLIGYQVGIFKESVLNGTIMMIIATCVTGSILTGKYAKELLISGSETVDFSIQKISDRILVPVKNPENMDKLMDLAFLLHQNSHSPVYPLNVVIEGPNAEEGVIRGESLLTRAVARANAAQKESIPLTRIDINVSGAIMKSIKEQRISKVVLGWSDSSSFQSNVFSNVLEQFIRDSDAMVFIARISHPLPVSKRILLVIPTLMTRQNGFINTLETLIQFAQSISSRLIFVSDERSIGDIRQILLKKPVPLEYDFYPLENWKNCIELLKKMVNPDDLLIQIQARQGQLAWRLNFYRMAGKLGQAFPENNLMAVFPPIRLDDFGENEIQETIPSRLSSFPLLSEMPAKNFLFNVHDSDLKEVFKMITKRDFHEEQGELYEQLTSVLLEYPAELTEEITLIHIHTYRIKNYQTYIATHPEGFILPSLLSRPKIIFILFSPKDQPSQNHLQILSEIAKLAMDKNFTSAALRAGDYADFTAHINSLRQGS
jgi:Kef-type K+ transport system membrane component KefB/mannitol/fructose-specific phosphotransferase system IIA component (Ntr-type)/nucleotide-binding universal stress UspA family protein